MSVPGSRRRVRGCTGLSAYWSLVVLMLGSRLIGSLGGSGSVVSAMRLYWFALAVLYCKIGRSGVTVPRGRLPGRLFVSHVSASAM